MVIIEKRRENDDKKMGSTSPPMRCNASICLNYQSPSNIYAHSSWNFSIHRSNFQQENDIIKTSITHDFCFPQPMAKNYERGTSSIENEL